MAHQCRLRYAHVVANGERGPAVYHERAAAEAANGVAFRPVVHGKIVPDDALTALGHHDVGYANGAKALVPYVVAPEEYERGQLLKRFQDRECGFTYGFE